MSEDLQTAKDRWDLRVKQVEFWYKIMILIIGASVAAIFYAYQQQQAETRYYADLMAQREAADSHLRVETFKTLFEAYFSNKTQAGTDRGQPAAAQKIPQRLGQDVVLSDLLARNFEGIDIRPVFEDLNDQLTRVIQANDGPSELKPTTEQVLAFRRREDLRRIAIGATSRQAAALEALGGDASARVSWHRIDTCRLDKYQKIEPDPPFPDAVLRHGTPAIVGVRDGAIIVKILRAEDGGTSTSAQSDNLTISFFDMPALENLYLKSGQRAAFSLFYYLSKDMCRRFGSALDDQLKVDCDNFPPGRDNCAVAQFRTVLLPPKFLGLHDRPYVNDLAAGKYRNEPWWKFW